MLVLLRKSTIHGFLIINFNTTFMGAYLIGHNLDLGEDDDFNVVLNRKDAERIGVKRERI